MDNDINFFRFWRNIVINKVIFKYVKLYKKNRYVTFGDLNSLREYKNREFIASLKIFTTGDNGNIYLSKGDLPEYGVLESLEISCGHLRFTNENGIIPYGVKKIIFGPYNQIMLSDLPLSVTSVWNIILKKPYINYQIPNNITSISFYQGSMDPNEFYDIKLPPSIVTLDLSCLAYMKRENLPMVPLSNKLSIIPPSVVNLKIAYDENSESNLPVIPSTVKNLHLVTKDDGNDQFCLFNKNLIPYGVKQLTIYGTSKGFILSEYGLPLSITKLSLHFVVTHIMKDSFCGIPSITNEIEEHSIPNSVSDLFIKYVEYPISFENIFPCYLTNLSLKSYYHSSNKPRSKDLPPALKYFEMDNKEIDLSKISDDDERDENNQIGGSNFVKKKLQKIIGKIKK